jgi:hypothetical protein
MSPDEKEKIKYSRIFIIGREDYTPDGFETVRKLKRRNERKKQLKNSEKDNEEFEEGRLIFCPKEGLSFLEYYSNNIQFLYKQ